MIFRDIAAGRFRVRKMRHCSFWYLYPDEALLHSWGVLRLSMCGDYLIGRMTLVEVLENSISFSGSTKQSDPHGWLH